MKIRGVRFFNVSNVCEEEKPTYSQQCLQSEVSRSCLVVGPHVLMQEGAEEMT